MKSELETIIKKLNANYSICEMTRLANAGQMARAQEIAATLGLWDIWKEIGKAAGLPCDEQAKCEWIADYEKSIGKKG